jgi:LysR family hydrogen peroxide-inducible transcriptional activator
MVALGLGISLVPEMATHADRTRRLAYRSLGAEAPHRTIAMIHHHDRYHSRLVQEFIVSLRSHGERRASAR